MIRASGELKGAEGAQLTIAISMAVSEWREYLQSLTDVSRWPVGQVGSLIERIIRDRIDRIDSIVQANDL